MANLTITGFGLTIIGRLIYYICTRFGLALAAESVRRSAKRHE
jgi:hypothetical protein